MWYMSCSCVHWNTCEYLLPVPLCFIIVLKMTITFPFLCKEDFLLLWVGCFGYLPACFTVKRSGSCLFWKTSWMSENTVKFTTQIIDFKVYFSLFLLASYKEVEEMLSLIKHSFLQLSLVGIHSSCLIIIKMILVLERFQTFFFFFWSLLNYILFPLLYEWNLKVWLMFWQHETL